jgi:hypothetical protein
MMPLKRKYAKNTDKEEHTVLLHDLKELDDDFARGSNQDLSFASLFSIVLHH